MKTSYPQLAPVLLVVALLSASCRTEVRREVLGIKIARNLTHIAVGQTAQLTAFQEYRLRAGESGAASAEPVRDIRREAVAVRWSVSDPSVVSVSEDGTLAALNPGRVTIRGVWEDQEDSTTVDVLSDLQAARLPQINVSRGALCQPQAIELSLDGQGNLNFYLSFYGTGCSDVRIAARAPERPLPWEFPFKGGTVELYSSRGPVVSGAARLEGKGDASFTVWSDGAGAYPVSLAGKTVLLVGDSMAEGLAPSLQKRVEAAGGRFFGEPWQSSTIIGWEGTGRLRQMIERYQPDIIFISLGSNELEARRPEGRAPLIKQMLAEIGARPAFWISPPSWKQDRGLLSVIAENFQPGHFFNASNLQLPRQTDGKHPTLEGFEQWTELIWKWYARMI
ncbi:MAG: Ig-like domain-containing protein [Acidobacteria bacterium]|nr:Ig-like domain-containing protein [Acidobacteriota bacterium]